MISHHGGTFTFPRSSESLTHISYRQRRDLTSCPPSSPESPARPTDRRGLMGPTATTLSSYRTDSHPSRASLPSMLSIALLKPPLLSDETRRQHRRHEPGRICTDVVSATPPGPEERLLAMYNLNASARSSRTYSDKPASIYQEDR